MDYKKWLALGAGGLVVGTGGIIVASTVAMSSTLASGLALVGLLVDFGGLYACGRGAVQMGTQGECCGPFVANVLRDDIEAGQQGQEQEQGKVVGYGTIAPPVAPAPHSSWETRVSNSSKTMAISAGR